MPLERTVVNRILRNLVKNCLTPSLADPIYPVPMISKYPIVSPRPPVKCRFGQFSVTDFSFLKCRFECSRARRALVTESSVPVFWIQAPGFRHEIFGEMKLSILEILCKLRLQQHSITKSDVSQNAISFPDTNFWMNTKGHATTRFLARCLGGRLQRSFVEDP